MTLVIIDMQNAYRASQIAEKTVLSQIQEFKKKKRWIVNVTLGHSKVLPSITKVLKNYSKVIHVKKEYNDGTNWILAALKEHKLDASNLQICGVNTNACVIDTVRGLHKTKRVKNLEIAVYGCASWNPSDHLYSLFNMGKLKKVSFV